MGDQFTEVWRQILLLPFVAEISSIKKFLGPTAGVYALESKPFDLLIRVRKGWSTLQSRKFLEVDSVEVRAMDRMVTSGLPAEIKVPILLPITDFAIKDAAAFAKAAAPYVGVFGDAPVFLKPDDRDAYIREVNTFEGLSPNNRSVFLKAWLTAATHSPSEGLEVMAAVRGVLKSVAAMQRRANLLPEFTRNSIQWQVLKDAEDHLRAKYLTEAPKGARMASADERAEAIFNNWIALPGLTKQWHELTDKQKEFYVFYLESFIAQYIE